MSLKEHAWRKTRIKTCAIGATHEGKPVKQIFQVIAPGTFYAPVCTHSEQKHIQKTITNRQPKTTIFLPMVKLTTNAPPIPSLLIGQVKPTIRLERDIGQKIVEKNFAGRATRSSHGVTTCT
eukprot:3631762-Amphidinium_carterae.2